MIVFKSNIYLNEIVMKKLKLIIVILFLLFSCSKESNPEEGPIPNLQAKKIVEIKPIEGDYYRRNNWQLNFSGNKMTSASSQMFVFTQVYATVRKGDLVTYNLMYTGNILKINQTDSGSNYSISYIAELNPSGYIKRMTCENFINNYISFEYSSDGYIKTIHEFIDDSNAFEKMDNIYTFIYQNGNLNNIDFKGKFDSPSSTSFKYGSELNKSGISVINDFSYWFAIFDNPIFELLHYGGLVGKSSKNLPISVEEFYPETDEKDITTFFYSFNDGYVTKSRVNFEGFYYVLEYTYSQ